MSQSLKLKVCGNNNPANMVQVAALQPDYMGFIFYALSKRNACELDPQIVKSLPQSIKPVAVFVNETYDTIIRITKNYMITILQLHGAESPELCQKLRKEGYTVIKQFPMDSSFDFQTIKPYKGRVDYILFDTKTETHGGSGQTFDRGILKKYKYHIPFFLAGGIGDENIAEVIASQHPYLYAIDINSKVESEAWIKDIDKVKICVKYFKTQ